MSESLRQMAEEDTYTVKARIYYGADSYGFRERLISTGESLNEAMDTVRDYLHNYALEVRVEREAR